MNIKHCSALLVTLFCITAHAQDGQTHQSPFVRNLLAAKAPTSGFSQEEMDKLVALIRAIAQENNVKIEEDDLIFQAQLRLFCKQIHEQTGTLLTPTELFNNMNAACEDIGAWKLFCAEHGLEYITPIQLFEQFVATQQQSKNVELNKKLLLGVGLGIGGLGGVTAGVIYADSIKNMLTIVGAYSLASALDKDKRAIIVNTFSLSKKLEIGLNISLDTLLEVCKYQVDAHQVKKAIENAFRNAADYEYNQTYSSTLKLLKYIPKELPSQQLTTLEQAENLAQRMYEPTYIDYGLIAADSITSNLIMQIPLPEKDTAYLTSKDGEIILISQNQLTEIAKKSGMEILHQAIISQLSSNKSKPNNDTTKIAMPNLKTAGCILAENTAKELSYGLLAQIAHKQIAPNIGETTADILQACFPDDGISKNGIQELTKLATISAITLCAAAAKKCAAAGLNFVTNNAYRLSRRW